MKSANVIRSLKPLLYFSESLKEARGNITDETVARHSQMVGSMGKVLDRVFTHSLDMDAKDFIKKKKIGHFEGFEDIH